MVTVKQLIEYLQTFPEDAEVVEDFVFDDEFDVGMQIHHSGKVSPFFPTGKYADRLREENAYKEILECVVTSFREEYGDLISNVYSDWNGLTVWGTFDNLKTIPETFMEFPLHKMYI